MKRKITYRKSKTKTGFWDIFDEGKKVGTQPSKKGASLHARMLILVHEYPIYKKKK